MSRLMEVQRPTAGSVWPAVAEWRALAVRALRRMYRPDERLFAFEIEADVQRVPRLQGISGRYTAIALIGLSSEPDQAMREVLGEHTRLQVGDRLVDRALQTPDYGEVALTLWCTRVLAHPRAGEVLDRLRALRPESVACPTVELAWSLTALVVPADGPSDAALAERIAQRLATAYREGSSLFAHWPAGTPVPRLRAHVACFADLVYPIQAFAYHNAATGSPRSCEMATRCAERMCSLQGPAGQWWWHYDIRSGRVLEGYPVYAIHQDAMGPMALFAVEEACGVAHHEAIAASARWLLCAPELRGGSLVDGREDLIWRKVARHEPGKLVRTLQASISGIHPRLRVPGMDLIFRPTWIDRESRPYHMGWLLHAFTPQRLQGLVRGIP